MGLNSELFVATKRSIMGPIVYDGQQERPWIQRGEKKGFWNEKVHLQFFYNKRFVLCYIIESKKKLALIFL